MTPSRFVEHDDWRIHYTVQGAGPELILLHGGGPGATGASNYSRNIETLAKSFTTYVIDFPGWGQSSKNLSPPGEWHDPFQRGGQALAAFMDAAGIARAHVVGNSFGGSAALHLAMDQPQKVDRLVLMAPGGGLAPGQTGPTPGIVKLLTYYFGEGPTQPKLESFLQHLTFDKTQLTPELLRQRFEASNKPEITANPPLRPPPRPPVPENALCNDPRLAALATRTLFIWGMQDEVNPCQAVTSFARIPNHDVLLFNQCGHWAQWEQAEKFNELVPWFLGRP